MMPTLYFRLMDALGDLVTLPHGVVDWLNAMGGPAEASPSRIENPAPMGVIDAGLSPMRLLEDKQATGRELCAYRGGAVNST